MRHRVRRCAGLVLALVCIRMTVILAKNWWSLLIRGVSALVLGLIGARFLKSSERRGGRFGDGQRFGRERSFGYTGYNQPYTGAGEIGGSYTGSEREFGGGYGGGSEGGYGGGYAGA